MTTNGNHAWYVIVTMLLQSYWWFFGIWGHQLLAGDTPTVAGVIVFVTMVLAFIASVFWGIITLTWLGEHVSISVRSK